MFTPEMLASVKKVEATRDARMGMEPRRMTAEEKDALLKAYHPDYREDGFDTIKIGPNKGQKVPKELGHLLHSNSRLLDHPVDLNKIDYDVDVLVIGGGGAGASAAIEAHNAGANVMIVTKLRIGDANTMRRAAFRLPIRKTTPRFSTTSTPSAAATLRPVRSCSAASSWKRRTRSSG